MGTIKVSVSTKQYKSLKSMLENNNNLNPTIKSILFDVINSAKNKLSDDNGDLTVSLSCYISPEQVAVLRSPESRVAFNHDTETADFLTQFTEFRVKSSSKGNVKVTMTPQQYTSLKKMLAEKNTISLTVRSILFDALKGMEKKMAGRDMDIIGFCQFPCYISPDQIAYFRSAEGRADFVFDEETEDFLAQFTEYAPKLYS